MSNTVSHVRGILWASIGTLALTILHHLYGAIIYDAPFRMYLAYFALPVLLILVVSFRISRKQLLPQYSSAAYWVLFIVTLLIPIVGIGIVEGSNLLKNAGSERMIVWFIA